MCKDKDEIRLQHMFDAVVKAIEFTKVRKREELDKDEMLALALVRLLEILGEAAKGVSEPIRNKFPAIPWKSIAGTRDRLIHGYYDVDLDIVWKIITEDLPALKTQLEKVLANQP